MLTYLCAERMMCVSGMVPAYMEAHMKKVKDGVYELDGAERQWVHKALETQRNVLLRSRTKETVGSEIYALRSKEIEALNLLMAGFA